jgi:hypothetical protein
MRTERRFLENFISSIDELAGQPDPKLDSAATVGTMFFSLMMPLTLWLAEVSNTLTKRLSFCV